MRVRVPKNCPTPQLHGLPVPTMPTCANCMPSRSQAAEIIRDALGVSCAETVTDWLLAHGYERETDTLWYHPELGGSRTFMQVIEWQLGRESR